MIVGGQEVTSKDLNTRLVQLIPILFASQPGKPNGLREGLDGVSSEASNSCDILTKFLRELYNLERERRKESNKR